MFTTYQDAAAAAAARQLAPGNPLTQPIEAARRAQNRYLEALVENPRAVAAVSDRTVPGPLGPVPVRFTTPLAVASAAPVIHVRGGGWWSGTLEASTAIVNQLADVSGCIVGAIDYRPAPEHRYPAQLEELLALLAWLNSPAAGPELNRSRPILIGESAGASLCLAAAMRLRDRNEPLPLAIVQFYTNAKGPPPNGRAMTNWVWNNYLPSPEAARDAGAAPLSGRFTDLPPMWLGVGEQDHLLVDTLELGARCAAEAIPCETRRYPDMPHGFLQFVSTLQPASAALDDAARYIRRIATTAPTR